MYLFPVIFFNKKIIMQNTRITKMWKKIMLHDQIRSFLVYVEIADLVWFNKK